MFGRCFRLSILTVGIVHVCCGGDVPSPGTSQAGAEAIGEGYVPLAARIKRERSSGAVTCRDDVKNFV